MSLTGSTPCEGVVKPPSHPSRCAQANENSSGEARRPAFFIGHGLGAAAIAGAAHALDGADVRGAFLVPPPDEAGLGRLAGAEWTASSALLPCPSLVAASRDDADGADEAVALTHRNERMPQEPIGKKQVPPKTTISTLTGRRRRIPV